MQMDQAFARNLNKLNPAPKRAWLAQELIILRYLSSAGETPCSLAARMRRSEHSIMTKLTGAVSPMRTRLRLTHRF